MEMVTARRAPRFEDALGQSLRRLDVGHAFSCYQELTSPFGVSFPSTGATAGFHMVFAGTCWLAPEGGPGRWLHVGDVALMPHGTGHAITDRPGSATVLYHQVRAQKQGGEHALLCGSYRFGRDGLDPVLALLPQVVHVPARRVSTTPGFGSVLAALREEVGGARPGHDAVVTALVDAAFVHIVRSWFAHEDPADGAWLTALRDPGLSRCLAGIHADPRERWTVEKLAELAGMSRAAFARRFTQRVGVTPLAYVAARRLDAAARLLRETDEPLGAIAAAVGYESEFALSRAFKRSRLLAPGRYRTSHRRAARGR
jgi:AraC-like DNA-binding protein